MNVTPSIDVVVSGHLCLDLIPDMQFVPLEGFARPGQLYEIGPLTISTGGVVSNTGLALHRLGVDVRLMAAVGDDQLGRLTVAILKERDERLVEHIAVQPGQSSSYTVVMAPAKADRIFLHSTGPNSTFSAADIDFKLLRQTRLFHLGYPPVLPQLTADDGAGLSALYQQAQAAGAVTSLDMALPDPKGASGRVNWPRVLARTLPSVDIFLPSIEEALFTLRRRDYDGWQGAVRGQLNADYLSALADELLAYGAAIVGLKLGEMGLYLKTAPFSRIAQLTARLPINPAEWDARALYIPSFSVDVVNTLGAGDAAYAGFLAALVRGYAPEAAIRWACAVGACNCEVADAISGVRTWDATQQRMDSGWPMHDVRLPGI